MGLLDSETSCAGAWSVCAASHEPALARACVCSVGHGTLVAMAKEPRTFFFLCAGRAAECQSLRLRKPRERCGVCMCVCVCVSCVRTRAKTLKNYFFLNFDALHLQFFPPNLLLKTCTRRRRRSN